MRAHRVSKIIAGGQTGVDRAALDVAGSLGVTCGGWCPRGRRAEDGVISPRYPLSETPSDSYPQRTEWNVRDADGTLILAGSRLIGGTALTAALARRQNKPLLVIDLEKPPQLTEVSDWLAAHRIGTLNVAGPRESTMPGIYDKARAFLIQLLNPDTAGS